VFKQLQIPESKLAHLAHSPEWALIPSTRWGPSPCRSCSGRRKTSAQRTYSSMLQK
jgi:hypothetical protein